MDNKEIKLVLKNARDAISKKEFDVALQHCQTVLDTDNKNYNALVFMGVAADKLERNDAAIKAYQKATEVNPDQLLAWQGLCGFYEKNQGYVVAYKNNLIPIYEKLIDLYKSDASKKEETMKRLAVVLSDLRLTDKSLQVYKELLKLSSDISQQHEIKLTMIKLLESQDDVDTKLLFDCYDSCLESGKLTAEEKEVQLKNYVSIIIMKSGGENIESEINRLTKFDASSVVLLEHQVLMLLEKCIEKQTLTDNSLLREKMAALQTVTKEDNRMLKMVNGYFLLVEKKYEVAKTMLQSAQELYPNFAVVYCLLAASNLYLRNNPVCIKSVVNGLQVLKSGKKKAPSVCCGDKKLLEKYLLLLQCQALCNIGTGVALHQATELLLKNKASKESQILLCRVYMKQEKVDQAMELIKQLECEVHIKEFFLAWHEFLNNKFKEALSRLEKLCVSPESGGSEAWCMMGKALWNILQTTEKKEKEQKCYTTLLKAAQLDPKNGEPFLYLGHFYAKIRKDNGMAKKCYEKAFNLDSTLDEAGTCACDMMTALGEEESAYNLLLKVTREANAGSAKWAWLRLGLCQIKQENAISAISSFQSALRADTTDRHVWECLAEAYFYRGSYTAALKAFTRASELNPGSLYCKYQIATIMQTLCMYVDAIKEYKNILESSSDYVPALKGLGEANILLARNHLNENLDGRVKDNCEEALLCLTKAVSQRSEMSCLWKLLGDACMLIQLLGCENFTMSVPKKLLEKMDKGSEELVQISKQEVIQLSTRCYGRALKILPENSMLWHDLGVAYFYLSKLVPVIESKPLTEKAVGCMRKAVTLDSLNHRHWNALGVISASKDINNADLAQHCFIKSVHAETNNVVAWTNLGVLYLQYNNVNLAHESFKVAQSLDPNYVACWIGQAMIAETVGHEDTMDLYRHTTELAYHPEGSVGYAHWVCSVLQDRSKHHTDMFQYSIKQMAAIPSATDSMTRYLERHGKDTTALNMYGLLLEQQTFYTSAAKALQKCIKLLEAETVQDDSKLNKARLNLARVLCKQNLFEESVNVYKQTTSIEQAEDICNYGYTLYKAREFAESFKAYEKASEIVESDEERSHVYAALGMVAYKFGDLDGAKTALFTSSQFSPASINGLKALCALGLLQSDITLVTAVLQELFKQEDDYHSDTTWLTVGLELVQGNFVEPMKFLQRSLHTNPKLYQTWMILAELLVKYFPERGTASTNCIKVAEELNPGKNKEELRTVPLLSLAQLQSGQHCRDASDKNAVMSAQNALHNNPGNVRNWLSLICSIHAEACVRQCVENDTKLYYVELRYLDYLLNNNEEVQTNLKLKLWCCKQKIICLVETQQLDEAKAYLQQTKAELSGNGFSCAILNLVNGKQAGKPEVGNTDDILYICQLAVETYIHGGLFTESIDLLKQYSSSLAVNSDLEKCRKVNILIQATHITYKLLLKKEDDKLRRLFDESISEILQLDSNNLVALVMKGAVFLGTKNRDEKRGQMLAKKSLILSYTLSQFNSSFSLNGTDFIKKHLIKVLQSSKKEDPLLEELMKDTRKNEDQNGEE